MCGGGQSNEQKELQKRNAEIENGIKKDKITAEKEVKMLLLGNEIWLIPRSWRIRKINYSEANDPHLWKAIHRS
jgi:hypothetical protein